MTKETVTMSHQEIGRLGVIQPVVQDLSQVIDHANWRQGLGFSIAFGVSKIAVHGRYDGIMIALADQPQLTTDDFEQLIKHFDGSQIVAAHYAEASGVPAIFPATAFDELRQLRGDRGAKSILMDSNREIDAVPLAAAAKDIDTVADIGVMTR